MSAARKELWGQSHQARASKRALMDSVKRWRLNDGAAKKLRHAGVDHVIDSVAAPPALIDTLQQD